jgi:transcriptional regulator with XRE-family HTH domain
MGNFKIREFRNAMGLYQNDMAEIIGISQSNLSRYEMNGVDLTNEAIDKLRKRFGKENVDAFLTDSPQQIRDMEIPASRKDHMTMLDLVTIVKKQNETINKQIETQNDFTRQLTSMNERLLNLLEKFQFE